MTTSPTPMRRCPICTTSFTPHPRKRAQTYCTERCRQIAYRRRRAEARTDDPTHPDQSSSPSTSASTTNDDVRHGAHDEAHDEVRDDVREVVPVAVEVGVAVPA